MKINNKLNKLNLISFNARVISVPGARGMVFEGDGWTCWSLLALNIYEIGSFGSGKVQPFSLRQPELQKSMSDQVLPGHLEGPRGNCGNTTVVQSTGVALTWHLQSSEWPMKATQGGAVLGILWKFPSLAAVGKSPVGWETGPDVKLQGEQLPLGTFVFTLICIWICCMEKYGDASKAQPSSPGLAARTQWREGAVGTAGSGEDWPRGSCPRLGTDSKGPPDRNCGWPPASSWQATGLQTLSPGNGRWAGPAEIWPVRLTCRFAAAELVRNLTAFSGPRR